MLLYLTLPLPGDFAKFDRLGGRVNRAENWLSQHVREPLLEIPQRSFIAFVGCSNRRQILIALFSTTCPKRCGRWP